MDPAAGPWSKEIDSKSWFMSFVREPLPRNTHRPSTLNSMIGIYSTGNNSALHKSNLLNRMHELDALELHLEGPAANPS